MTLGRRGSWLGLVLGLAAAGPSAACGGRVDALPDAAPLVDAAPLAGPESVSVVADCTPATPVETNVAMDVVYAVMDGQELRLDVAWPATGGPYPLVVMIHGGGWSMGDKSGYDGAIQELAGQGFVAATLDYRLAAAPTNVFPAGLQDVRCAVRWLRSQASAYAIDPARVAAYGGSAGGNLASMLGVAADVAGLDGACPTPGFPVAVSAVVSLAGPQSLGELIAGAADHVFARDTLTNYFGADPDSVPATVALASPLTHVDASDPPFLLVHGTLDPKVPLEQSRAMQAALWSVGVPATLFTSTFGHDEAPPGPADARTIACTTLAFLRRALGS